MKCMEKPTYFVLTLALGISLGACFAQAQPPEENEPSATEQSEWYYQSNSKAEPVKPIVQQKAELKAQQRMARLETSRWYGVSLSRPTAAGMPFTSMYSPAWTRPGGRPFAWYTGYPEVHYHHSYRYR